LYDPLVSEGDIDVAKSRMKIPGTRLVHQIQQLIARGDVRRVCIIDEENSLLEIPLSVGDPVSPAAVLKAPVLAAIKAYGALVNECTVEVETADRK
jgi:hypothetical protein